MINVVSKDIILCHSRKCIGTGIFEIKEGGYTRAICLFEQINPNFRYGFWDMEIEKK